MRQILSVLLLTLCLINLAMAQDRGGSQIVIKDQSGQQVGLYEESHALLIGVSDYDYLKGKGWPDLPGVKKDLQAVKTTLEKSGFHVIEIKDPTSDELERIFTDFINNYGQNPENRLLFYFAGHGHTLTSSWGGEMGYIVPKNAPNPNYDETGFKKAALDMQMIEVYATWINSKHALFLFDSCFSGSIFNLSRAAPASITNKTAKPVRQFITSGSAEEEVPDKSIFRKQFVAALQGEGDSNKDGYVTGAELGEFLYNNVTNYSRNSQHPQYGKIRNSKLDKGDFVFPLNKKPVVAPPPKLPSSSNFSLDDLNQEAEKNEALKKAKKIWNDNLNEMKEAYDQVVAYEKRDASAASKNEAWQRFLNNFSDDNPYSQEDDRMRQTATKQLNYWKNYKAPPIKNVPVTSKVTGTSQTITIEGIEFVYVPGGTFQMGDQFDEGSSNEKPVHSVTLDGFYMGKYEITFAQYDRFCNATSREKPNDEGWGRGNRPVIRVSWDDATAFCEWFSTKSGKKVRLPTEAEWEYAAREGGKKVRFGNGQNTARPSEINFDARSDYKKSYSVVGEYRRKTLPVGSFRANSLGLCDMSGNVWEWCQDWYDKGFYSHSSSNNPICTNKASGGRLLRGGSWCNYPINLRAANRYNYYPTNRYWVIGFRVCFAR